MKTALTPMVSTNHDVMVQRLYSYDHGDYWCDVLIMPVSPGEARAVLADRPDDTWRAVDGLKRTPVDVWAPANIWTPSNVNVA